ncbi:MAG: hypothetical protein H0V37_05150 [Chloroflexia bacterium]|nr:hypothetical protein [Chloroflexia bacterium]
MDPAGAVDGRPRRFDRRHRPTGTAGEVTSRRPQEATGFVTTDKPREADGYVWVNVQFNGGLRG